MPKPLRILKITFSSRVPIDLARKVDVLAAKLKTTRTAIVTEALEAYLPPKP